VRPIDLPAAGDGSPANGVGGPDTRRENRYSLMLAYPDGPAEDRTKGMIRYHSRAEISLAEAVGVEYAPCDQNNIRRESASRSKVLRSRCVGARYFPSCF
jgi:hypothetical protein